MKIITLTLSPAVDIEYHVASIKTDTTSRAKSHKVTAGGKGINVSRALLACGIDKNDLITVAPLGGSTGKMLSGILAGEGIEVTAVEIAENTRVNTSVIGEDGHAVEVNAPGTPIGDAILDVEKLILDTISPADVLIIAGSCPSDVSKSYPSELCFKAKEKGATVVIDCDGEAMSIAMNADCMPDLIKPNVHELGELVDCDLQREEDIVCASQSMGEGVSVITTMAGDGAYYTENEKSYYFPSEKRKVVRLKGAGDTFLGAFVYAKYYLGKDFHRSMTFASKTAGDYVAGL